MSKSINPYFNPYTTQVILSRFASFDGWSFFLHIWSLKSQTNSFVPWHIRNLFKYLFSINVRNSWKITNYKISYIINFVRATFMSNIDFHKDLSLSLSLSGHMPACNCINCHSVGGRGRRFEYCPPRGNYRAQGPSLNRNIALSGLREWWLW